MLKLAPLHSLPTVMGAILAVSTLLTTTSDAAVVIDFDTPAAYTENFTKTATAIGVVDYNPNGYLVATGDTSILTYTAPGAPKFLSEGVAMTFQLAATATAGSIGLYARVDDVSHLGVLGLFSYSDNGAKGQLRLFYGATTTGGNAGTVWYNSTVLQLSRALSAESDLVLSFDQRSGSNSEFRLTVSDAQGVLLSTGWQTLLASNAYDAAGGVAMRLYPNGLTEQRIHQFAVIPEPSFVTMIAILSGGLFICRSSCRTNRNMFL